MGNKKELKRILNDIDNRLNEQEKNIDLLHKQINYLQKKSNEPIGNTEQLELIMGKWYKQGKSFRGINQYLICITEQDDLGVGGYGICDGVWFNNGNCYSKDLILASETEIEEALINEAKKRGFKEGINFKSAASGNLFEFKGNIGFYKSCNILSLNAGCIFDNGEWASIIEAEQEIDFSVPGQLVQSIHEDSKDLIIQTTGLQKEHDTFCGFVTKENKLYRKGDVSDDWACKEFKTYELPKN